MSDHICPKCKSVSNARIQRIGFLQNYVLPRFGLYPWECADCRNVFFLKARSRRHLPHADHGHTPNRA